MIKVRRPLNVKDFAGKLNRDQYLELYKGNNIELELTRWVKNREQGEVY
jgi:hypothetical protein